MSIEAVQQFLQQVSEDTALQSRLSDAINSDNDRDAVTQLGNQQGYSFTSEELWAEVQRRQSEFQQRQEAGELSDEELEAVAGGHGAGAAVAELIFVSAKIIGGITPKATNEIKW
jgi:predicted ribosomally synthesized peptide with nif11-like leader